MSGLLLYGKQLWRGSSKWSYYTGTDKMHQIKLPIVSKNRQCMNENGCDEVYYPFIIFYTTISLIIRQRYHVIDHYIRGFSCTMKYFCPNTEYIF